MRRSEALKALQNWPATPAFLAGKRKQHSSVFCSDGNYYPVEGCLKFGNLESSLFWKWGKATHSYKLLSHNCDQEKVKGSVVDETSYLTRLSWTSYVKTPSLPLSRAPIRTMLSGTKASPCTKKKLIVLQNCCRNSDLIFASPTWAMHMAVLQYQRSRNSSLFLTLVHYLWKTWL